MRQILILIIFLLINTNTLADKKFEKDLKKGFPIEDWNKLHLQIIFYGREFCTARGCDGRVCKICSVVNKGRKSPIVTNKA